MIYSKPYLTIQEQIDLIEGRGLAIADKIQAEHYLSNIGYYRFSGYAYVFKKIEIAPDLTYTVLNHFKDSVDFKDILALYIFDKKLKLLLMDAIERVEISLRVSLALEIGKHSTDPFARKLFKDVFLKKQNGYAKCKSKYQDCFNKSSEDFAKHFKDKYAGCDMPVWIAVELWDFGLLSIYLGGLKDEYLKPICERYGASNLRAFLSWLRMINIARNICAHHGRLWNRSLPITISVDDAVAELNNLSSNYSLNKVFSCAAIIKHLLKTISPNSSWVEKFNALITEFPDSQYINIRDMGFPEAWERFE